MMINKLTTPNNDTLLFKSSLLIGMCIYSAQLFSQIHFEIPVDTNTLGNQAIETHNLGLTTNSDIADINNDSWPDIFDANSDSAHTGINATDTIIRINNQDGSFSVLRPQELQTPTSFDVDFVDVNVDGYPDLLRAELIGTESRVALYLNNQNAAGVSSPYFDLRAPNQVYWMNGDCPNDLDIADYNGDGLPDFAVVGSRIGGNGSCFADDELRGQLFLHTGIFIDSTDTPFFGIGPVDLNAPGNAIHSIFSLDADDDGDLDVIVTNRPWEGSSHLLLNQGEFVPTFVHALSFQGAHSGASADLNGDNLTDFILAGNGLVTTHINNSSADEVNFIQRFVQHGIYGEYQDVEVGDFDLDGDLDFATTRINSSVRGGKLWLNNGERDSNRVHFTGQTSENSFPGQLNEERLSVNVFDFDLDGDAEIYLSGGGSANGCLDNCIPNQLFINPTVQNPTYNNFEQGFGRWQQLTSDSHDWTIVTGPTPSSNTGPIKAASGASYIYLETSAGAANAFGNTAELESPIVSGSNRTLQFDYHMAGFDIGQLEVKVHSPITGTTVSVFSLIGEQQPEPGSAWRTQRVDLSNFAGDIAIIISATALGGFLGDIALDNLMISGENVSIVEL